MIRTQWEEEECECSRVGWHKAGQEQQSLVPGSSAGQKAGGPRLCWVSSRFYLLQLGCMCECIYLYDTVRMYMYIFICYS